MVKKSFQELYSRTAGFLDNLCCSSYSNAQVDSEVSSEPFHGSVVPPYWVDSCDASVDNRYASVDEPWKIDKPSRVVTRGRPHSPTPSMYTATTVATSHTRSGISSRYGPGRPDTNSSSTASTSLSTDGSEDAIQRHSPRRKPSSSRSISGKQMMDLRQAVEFDLYRTHSSSFDDDYQQQPVTPREVSVPSPHPSWSDRHGDVEIPSPRMMKKVQKESLKELRHLSTTEGYRC